MSKLQKLYPTLVGDLALETRKEGAVGRRSGFPVGLKVVNAEGKGTVMLHARFPNQVEPIDRHKLTFDHTLQRLMNEKLAEVSIDRDIAFLSLRKAADRIEKREAVAAVDEFIAGLTRAGVSAGEACHYCGSDDNVTTAFNGDRVGQICDGCARAQAIALLDERRFDPRSTWKLAITSSVVIPVLAAAWAALWLGVDALFTSQGGSINLPVKLSLIVALLAGWACATPALFFRRVRQRGDVAAGLIGGFCAVAAFGLGELMIASLRVWQLLGTVSLKLSASLVGPMIIGGNGLFLLERGIALAAFVGGAFIFAKPPKAKLKL